MLRERISKLVIDDKKINLVKTKLKIIKFKNSSENIEKLIFKLLKSVSYAYATT